jgi:hypothetical protein
MTTTKTTTKLHWELVLGDIISHGDDWHEISYLASDYSFGTAVVELRHHVSGAVTDIECRPDTEFQVL